MDEIPTTAPEIVSFFESEYRVPDALKVSRCLLCADGGLLEAVEGEARILKLDVQAIALDVKLVSVNGFRLPGESPAPAPVGTLWFDTEETALIHGDIWHSATPEESGSYLEILTPGLLGYTIWEDGNLSVRLTLTWEPEDGEKSRWVLTVPADRAKFS